MRSVAAAKTASFTEHGLASGPKHPELTKVVDFHFERQARAEERSCSFAQASSELPREERASWEAAIQLDLVNVNTAEAQISQGRTVAAWMAGQKSGSVGDCKGPPRKSLDKALLLALAMFNLLVLVALATAVIWVFKLFT